VAEELIEHDEEELIARATVAEMIYPFYVPEIRAEMARILARPKCAAFVKQLIELVSSSAQPTNTLVEGGDLLKIFDKVTANPNGLVRTGDAANGAIGGANFAWGSLANGTARIQVGNYLPGIPFITRKQLKLDYINSDAKICIHECIHHAGKLLYTDEQCARAVSVMNGNNPALPATTDRFKFSDYWDIQLRRSYK
jgi:hypothetical protein